MPMRHSPMIEFLIQVTLKCLKTGDDRALFFDSREGVKYTYASLISSDAKHIVTYEK